VSFERTSAPETFGFEDTRASVWSKSALFNDGTAVAIDIVSSRQQTKIQAPQIRAAVGLHPEILEIRNSVPLSDTMTTEVQVSKDRIWIDGCFDFGHHGRLNTLEGN
jgi:hypothetical protein